MPIHTGDTAFIDIPGGIDLEATFESGQAFRWRAVSPGVYEGVAGRHKARVFRTDGGIAITPCQPEQYEGFWRHYLDMDGDYGSMECELARDPVLAPIVLSCKGLRLLNQPVWECLVSFILSSNNNIKRISGIVEKLSCRYGDEMGGYFAFPSPEQLAAAGPAGIAACGAGYRADYIARTAGAVVDGFDVQALPRIGYLAARAELLKLHGVGEKVADCVLLYSCGYREAFPVDVWVRRAVSGYFAAGDSPGEQRLFAASRFGRLAGLAQQYLFYYERVLKQGKPAM